MLEDYSVLYFGSAMFKIGRLLLIAMMCVHVFACLFFRVKKESAASPDDVTAFYASKAVDPDVGAGDKPSHPVLTKSLNQKHPVSTRLHRAFAATLLPARLWSSIVRQLVFSCNPHPKSDQSSQALTGTFFMDINHRALLFQSCNNCISYTPERNQNGKMDPPYVLGIRVVEVLSSI
jgi:hypothetical protein